MVPAEPEDLQVENETHLERYFVQVVCGARSIAEVPEQLTNVNEVVLNVVSFTNQPQYDPSLGPIALLVMAH